MNWPAVAPAGPVRAAAAPARRICVARQARKALTFVELLAAIAALVILLGLMVNLARHVRGRSADALTGRLLAELEATIAQYEGPQWSAFQRDLAAVPDLAVPGDASMSEESLRMRAAENSRQFVAVCRRHLGQNVFSHLPLSLFDGSVVRDAWGTPVVFMRRGAPNVAIAPQDRWFFLSAGPDRKFRTVADNLYGYEQTWRW